MSSPPLPRNGCFNRLALVPFVVAQDGWRYNVTSDHDRIPELRLINNPMSKDCQYSKTTADERCDGCKWKQGE